ncbi:MAG: BrnT family toxin [Acidobacteriota bacterium]|nr:MAG: BrnT family toxin [Acidobacteriota bacterium]
MEYEWDHKKAAVNLRKHGIDFADAVTVLDDYNALTIPDPISEEERFVTMGLDALGRVLVVVYTWRDENIRIISARKATPGERNQYEEGQ